MPITVALDSDVSLLDSTNREFIADGTLTLTGSYPTNGDTLDLSQLGIPSATLVEMEIYEATPAPGPAYGGYFIFLPGTTLANGLMEIFNGTTQITTGTYASITGGITGFKLRFRAWFKSFV